MKTNHDPRAHRSSPGSGTRHTALLGAALLWLAGCGVTGVQGDPAAQEVMDTLNGYVGADGRTGCTVDIDGGNGACRSEVEWQRIVSQTCPAHGLTLVAYKTFEDCGPGKHRRVAYACCPADAPKPPSPPDPMCKEINLGDRMTCLGLDEWKRKAGATCEASKLQLTNLKAGSACGMGLYNTVVATCCAVTPQPPNPGMCVASKLGDGMTCLDEASWKGLATRECTAKNLTLSDFRPTAVCGMGLYSAVEISCCGSNGGGGSCFSGTVGAAGMCLDPALLKERAESTCAAKMYRLKEFFPGAACDRSGNVSEAKYTCCM